MNLQGGEERAYAHPTINAAITVVHMKTITQPKITVESIASFGCVGQSVTVHDSSLEVYVVLECRTCDGSCFAQSKPRITKNMLGLEREFVNVVRPAHAADGILC